MFTRLLLVGALALPLAACGNDTATVDPATTTTMDPVTPMTPADPLADNATVDGTNAAIGADITAMPMMAATQNIDSWISQLEGDRFADIRASLEMLKLDLAAQPLDGAKIGATLSTLGQQTTAAAAGASSSSQAGLQALGTKLSSAGAMLSGGTAM